MPYGSGPKLYKRKYPHTSGISIKHKLLVDKYFENGFNKDRAAQAAGYSAWRQYSNKLFNHPDVLAEIERRRMRLEKKYELTEQWIVQQLMALATSNVVLAKFIKIDENGKTYWDFTGATTEELSLIHDLQSDTIFTGGEDAKTIHKLKITKADPMRALELLGRIQGVFNKDRSGAAEINVDVKIDDTELARKLAFMLAKGVKKQEETKE